MAQTRLSLCIRNGVPGWNTQIQGLGGSPLSSLPAIRPPVGIQTLWPDSPASSYTRPGKVLAKAEAQLSCQRRSHQSFNTCMPQDSLCGTGEEQGLPYISSGTGTGQEPRYGVQKFEGSNTMVKVTTLLLYCFVFQWGNDISFLH